VPALIVRRASTTVELRDGQSFVIGGLLQTDNKNQIEQLPWIGSVPVLGALFSSKSYQKNETDLAIVVTPRLVRPARPGDVIKTPADDTLQPNDVDFFLLGKNEVTREEARQLTPATARFAVAGDRPFTGHMLDMPKGESNAAIQ
jgi:pilus assembly protein CpaC